MIANQDIPEDTESAPFELGEVTIKPQDPIFQIARTRFPLLRKNPTGKFDIIQCPSCGKEMISKTGKQYACDSEHNGAFNVSTTALISMQQGKYFEGIYTVPMLIPRCMDSPGNSMRRCGKISLTASASNGPYSTKGQLLFACSCKDSARKYCYVNEKAADGTPEAVLMRQFDSIAYTRYLLVNNPSRNKKKDEVEEKPMDDSFDQMEVVV